MQLTPQKLSAEPRNSASAEALGVAISIVFIEEGGGGETGK